MSCVERIIRTRDDLPSVMRGVHELISKGLQAGAVAVVLTRPNKSREQEKKYHAIIRDIWRTGITDDGESIRNLVSEPRLLKAVVVGRYEQELREQGHKLREPGRHVWDWERGMMVQERASTTGFTVGEARDFIEFLQAEGSRYHAQWSPIVTRIYDEYLGENK